MRLALVLLAACNGAGSTDFTIDGNVSGPAAPMSGDVLVSWQLAGQTAYPFGGGTATKTTFTVDLTADAPAQALNRDGFGVGVFVLDAGGTQVGASSDYAVIWKTATTQAPAHAWEASFAARYSCAHCVRGGAGSLDSYELTACSSVTIVVPATTPCAWY